MIHIDRSRVPPPSELGARWAEESQRAREFFNSEAGRSGQGQFSFSAYRHPEVKQVLRELFYGKCAFCETRLDDRQAESVELFRPRQNTVGRQGEHSPLHYWWLAGEWSNLYLACQICNASKSTRFPIEAERCEVEATGAALVAERPLLLDPCAPGDNPEEHLVYTDDGRVTSDTHRGRVTVEVFNLNREALVAARVTRLEALHQWLQILVDLPRQEESRLWPHIAGMLRAEAEFAGMCRQVVRRDLADKGHSGPREPERRLRGGSGVPAGVKEGNKRGLGFREPESFDVGLSPAEQTKADPSQFLSAARYVSRDQQSKLTEEFDETQQEAQKDTLDDEFATPEQAERYYLRSRRVERIVLHNFRGIEHLELDLVKGEGPWTVLLGENGCGKSSVLQAVALALMGKRYRDCLELDAGGFVRRESDGEGYVQVFLSGMNEPIHLAFQAGQKEFEGAQEPKVLLLGYGATRLLPRAKTQQAAESYGTHFARAHNLFDPFQPLADAQRWLLGLEPAVFENLQPALKALLNLSDGDDIRRNPVQERIDVTLFGTSVPLTQLSDGYQTVVALTAEVMSILLDRWQEMAVAEGIVLLDELGSHLHPKWKMQIVSSLRAVFPRVQFIATTHDPLCLRGLEDGEVVVLRRNRHQQIVQVRDLPPVKALRVDQLLTSEHFGLSSTQDPESARLLEEYYELLALEERSEDQDGRLRQLQDDLGSFNLLGQTRRERLMLTAIDEYLAREAETQGTADAISRKAALDRRLERILDRSNRS